LLTSDVRRLSPQHPHRPACKQRSAEEHHEAIEAVAYHFAGILAVGDSEDDRREQSEDACCTEVVESDAHLCPYS